MDEGRGAMLSPGVSCQPSALELNDIVKVAIQSRQLPCCCQTVKHPRVVVFVGFTAQTKLVQFMSLRASAFHTPCLLALILMTRRGRKVHEYANQHQNFGKLDMLILNLLILCHI